jgi:2-methylcitrate dehydratase PrpD
MSTRVEHPATDVASVTERFARFALTLTWDGLPEDVRTALVVRLLDHLGLVAVGALTEPGAAAVRTATLEAGRTPLLFGDAEVTAVDAAFVHGTLAHVLDFDDTYPDSVIHPSSVVLPAALAAADPTALLADVLTASAPAYELLARVGRDAGRDFHARGFHPTAVLGPLAAALAAGRVRGAPEAQLVAAMGLAGSMSSGLLEFLSDGTWSKRMHPGWAAAGGLRAAQLAGNGFLGPRRIVEGRHGVFASFLGRGLADPSAVEADLGGEWHSRTATVKLLPCAHVIHPFVTMVRSLRADRPFTAADVEAIRCDVAPWYMPIVCEPREEKVRPVSEYQARASLPYVLAVVLHDLNLGLETFEPPVRDDASVLDLCERIACEADATLARGFGGRMRITLRDGRVLEMDAGDIARPADPVPGIMEKFRANLDRAGRPELADLLIEATRDPAAVRVGEVVAITRRMRDR